MTEVTDEMRQAVYEWDCENYGHQPNITKMFATPELTSTYTKTRAIVIGPDDDTLPHIFCNRCGLVWLVIPESGKNYDDAVEKLNKKVSDPAVTSINAPKRKAKIVDGPIPD